MTANTRPWTPVSKMHGQPAKALARAANNTSTYSPTGDDLIVLAHRLDHAHTTFRALTRDPHHKTRYATDPAYATLTDLLRHLLAPIDRKDTRP